MGRFYFDGGDFVPIQSLRWATSFQPRRKSVSGQTLFRDIGLPQRSIIQLKAVINTAAHLVLRVKKFDHISTLMRDELQ